MVWVFYIRKKDDDGEQRERYRPNVKITMEMVLESSFGHHSFLQGLFLLVAELSHTCMEQVLVRLLRWEEENKGFKLNMLNFKISF